MKKVIGMIVLAALASPAFAGFSAVITDAPGDSYSPAGFGTGGAFIATVTGFGEFQTFCVEDVPFHTKVPYYFTIDNTIEKGGAVPTTLDFNTKRLYASYLSLSAVDQAANGWKYQRAIWYLEGVYGSDPGDIAALIAAGDSSKHGRVKVLNLWGDAEYSQDRQSDLIMVPAPGALILGSLGMGLVGWLRRRQAV